MNIEKYHEMEGLEKYHWWFVYRQKILKKILKKHLFNLKKDAKIIDIGCGTGGNIQLLSKDFTDIIGIDNNDIAIEYCKSKNLKNILKAQLPDLNILEDNSADLILLFDVLEHVEDDFFALSVIKNKLKEGGYLLLTVPAFAFLWSQHDEEFHHKKRYNLKQIEKMFKETNFKILKSSYLYFLTFPAVLFMRILKQIFKSCAKKDDFKINNGFLNSVIIKFLSVEALLLNYFSFPFGSSLLILAKKGGVNE